MKFDDKEFIANRVKYYRKKMNLTQAELAEKVELSDQHISRIESACYIPSLKSFFMLATVLNMDLKEFGYNDEHSENPIKEELIHKINNSNDIQLMFYRNSMDFIDKSLVEVKDNYHIYKLF